MPDRVEPAREALEARAELEVAVLDARGDALEGALVGFAAEGRGPFAWANDRALRTDAEGRADLPLSWLERQVAAPAIVALGAQHAPARELARIHEGQQVVRLEPGSRAILELVDPAGRAVRAPARAELAGPSAAGFELVVGEMAPPAANGELELLGLPPGETPLIVRAEGFAARVVNVIAAPSPLRRRVELRPETILEILVRGPSGLPLAGARAELSCFRGEGTTFEWSSVLLDAGTTDAAGRLGLGGLEAGRPATLLVRAAGCRAARVELSSSALASGLLTIDLAPAGVLEVELLDGQERPVRAVVALVDLSRSSIDTRLLEGIVAEELAQPGGLARFEELPLGVPLGIRVQSAGGPSSEIWTTRRIEPLTAHEPRSVVLRLEDALRVEGTLRVAGRPAAGAVYLAHQAAGLRHDGSLLAIAADGRIEAWLARGSYEMSTSAGGFFERRALELDAPTQLEIDLGPGGSLTGTLVDGRDAPLGGRVLRVSSRAGGSLASTTTRPDGSFIFEALPEGDLDLFVETGADAPLPIAACRAGQSFERLVLDEREIRGRVLDLASGSPRVVSLSIVPAGRLGPAPSTRMISAADGTFELRLPAGAWEVRPRAEDWVGVPSALQVEAGAAPLEVQLPVAPGLPHRWLRPRPTHGAGVLTATAEGPRGRWTWSHRIGPGRFTQLSLPAGRVALEFSADTGERWSGALHVMGGN